MAGHHRWWTDTVPDARSKYACVLGCMTTAAIDAVISGPTSLSGADSEPDAVLANRQSHGPMRARARQPSNGWMCDALGGAECDCGCDARRRAGAMRPAAERGPAHRVQGQRGMAEPLPSPREHGDDRARGDVALAPATRNSRPTSAAPVMKRPMRLTSLRC